MKRFTQSILWGFRDTMSDLILKVVRTIGLFLVVATLTVGSDLAYPDHKTTHKPNEGGPDEQLTIADDDDKKDGVVILKCAESIGLRFNADGQIVGTVPEEAAGFIPKVVMLEGTFDEPDSCGVPLSPPLAPCPECLRDLININGCRAHIAFPGSPLVVHSSKKAIPGTNYFLFLSITEYVFQCRGGVTER